MLLMKDIIRDGHPTLRQKAQEVVFPLSQEDREIAEKMMTFLKNSQDEQLAQKYKLRPGVGLAAPQINISKQIIALLVPGEYEDDPYLLNNIMINPKIVKHSVHQACLKDGEGCLSVDEEIQGYVPRFARITVEFYNLDGKKHTLALKGFPAIVVQHEIDHLNGVMFYDRINKDNPFYKDDNLSLLQ